MHESRDRRSLSVCLLSDGLPGHVNQARGLVQWLSSRYDVECRELDVTLRCRPLARQLLPLLLRLGRPGYRLAQGFYRYTREVSEKPDLIVSAGGNTSFLNVALARLWGVPNIYLGSKRRLNSQDFSAHLTLEPTGEANNIVMELAPTTVDLRKLSEEGQALRENLGLGTEEKLYALVIGGDGAGYKYDLEDWRKLATLITELSKRDGVRWLLTTSRRTGAAAERILKREIPAEYIADAVWWSQAPRKIMLSYLGAADLVMVTADSMSMITEAISSQKTVVVVRPDHGEPEKCYQAALDRFAASGFLTACTLSVPIAEWPTRSADINEIRNRFLGRLQQEVPYLNF